MNLKYPVSGAFGFELSLPNTKSQTKIYFGDIPELRSKNLKYIDVYTNFGNVKSMSGRKIVLPSSSYLTLTDYNNKEFLSLCPLTNNFTLLRNEGRRMLMNRIVDFTKSYVTIQDDFLLDGQSSLYFVFWYDDFTSQESNKPFNREMQRDIESVELIMQDKDIAFFPDNRVIANRKVRNIMLYPIPQFEEGLTPTGYSHISEGLFKNGFLTIKKGNYEIFKKVPLFLLSQSGLFYTLQFENILFDLTASFVEFSTPDLVEAGKSIFLNIEMEGI